MSIEQNKIIWRNTPRRVSKTIKLVKKIRENSRKKIIEKYDTEKFLVIVFRNRREKEELLASLGLPANERYIAASCLEIKRVADVEPVVGEGKSPPPHKAGATGGSIH